MLNQYFPQIHIVRGRPRHPQSQGSVERSHGPFKRALAQALTDADSDNWVFHMFPVQCAINNRPVRSRNDLSPYTMYYSRPNRSSYSSIFGQAYKEATSEYGLRLAKMFLKKLKALDPRRVLSQNEVRFLIRQGDVLFDNVATRDEAYNSQRIREACHSMLQVLDFEVPDIEQFDRESDLDISPDDGTDSEAVEGK